MPTPEPRVSFSRHPVDGPISGRFGDTYSVDGRTYLHRGVDYAVPVGTPVYAPAAGRSVAFTNDGSFGIGVCLEHEDGWFTLYAHLSQAAIPLGRVVHPGQLIGYSGNSGLSTGPHLHWQLCSSSQFPVDISYSRDPLAYMLLEEDQMTPQERELLLRVATILFGPPTGMDYQTVDEALARARQLTAEDAIVLQGLAEFQNHLALHTHGPDGRANWPGRRWP